MMKEEKEKLIARNCQHVAIYARFFLEENCFIS